MRTEQDGKVGATATGTNALPVAQNRRPKGSPNRQNGAGKAKGGGFWKKQARTWHWISGAVCLVGMLLFSLTGITLNHAADIAATPQVTEREFTLAPEVLAVLAEAPAEGVTRGVPGAVGQAIEDALGVSIGGRRVEWTEFDAYVGLPRPGGDAWLSIDRESGAVVFERTTRGAIAYLNDLHKGRNTGVAWSWFIDIFSVASILFCLTGLWLLQIHAGKRRSTWPLTIAGFALPALLAIYFIH
jgi:hypothetical protein